MAKMIEVKHEVIQVLSIKTRGAATLIHGDNPLVKNQVLAKVGVSPPEDCKDTNQYIVDLFLNRQPGQKTMTRPFVPIRDQWVKLMDVFRMEREVKLSFEYDFKRRPVNARMVDAGGTEHLAFDTVPWSTLEEAERARVFFDSWRKSRCLKTMEDWNDWQDRYLTLIGMEKVRKQLGKGRRLPVQVTDEGSAGILKRLFLRAYAKREWGLQRTLSYPKLLLVLKEIGFPVTDHDAKNGNKGILLPNIVPRTPRTEALMAGLLLAFAGLDVEQVFIPD
jgi:hypothetical protein